MISKAEAREALHYDPETGVLTWKHRRESSASWNTRYAGKEAGCRTINGYRMLSIFGGKVLAHRMAFIWMTGDCPEYVDHRDGKTMNNAWANLRESTYAQNNANKRPAKNSSSKYLGVCWDKQTERWIAHVTTQYRQMHIGRFNSEEDAARAYDRAAEKVHGEFANLNFRPDREAA